MKENSESLILFDGVCNLCNSFVRFVAKRDSGEFSFAPLQSKIAEKKLRNQEIDPESLETFILIDKGEIYTQSDAAVKLFHSLGGKWKAFSYILSVIPGPLRDIGYSVVARTRYQVFGKKDSCMIPEDDLSKRFLSENS